MFYSYKCKISVWYNIIKTMTKLASNKIREKQVHSLYMGGGEPSLKLAAP